MKKLICLLLTAALLISVLMSTMVFSASAGIVPTSYGNDEYEDYSEAPSECPAEEYTEPCIETCAPEPSEASTEALEPVCKLNYNELSDGTLEVCGFTNNTGAVDLLIPSEYNGKAVTKIAESVFMGNHDIVSVTIPETITYIDSRAFAGCDNLEIINYNCINAYLYYWTNYSVSYSVFQGCNAVREINIGNNVESIPDYAFAGIDINNISIFIIPENVKSIGQNIFNNNVIINTLEYNAIECEVGVIESWKYSKYYYKAFPKLNTVIVGKNVNEIPSDTYREPFAETNLSTVIFKDGIKNVSGFCNCNEITDIYIPDGVEKISERAFMNCSKLETVIVPKSVTKVGKNAFYNTAWLNNQPSGTVYINNLLYYYKDSTQDEDVVVREGTTEIVEGAFYDASHIKSIVIPGSVRRIYDYAFSNKGIESVSLGEGIIELGAGAFYGCQLLETIHLPNGLTIIGNNAFENCTSLKTAIIGDGVKTIGYGAFSGCSSLETVNIPNGLKELPSQYYRHSWEESGYYNTGIFENCTSLKSISIPDSVKSIDAFTFKNCTSLKTVTIGKGVADIGCGAFVGCTSLETVNIPNGVKELPSQYISNNTGIFENCTNLNTVTIPDSVKSIGAYTFRNCISLKRASIGKGVDDISCGAFMGCTSLETVNIPDGIAEISDTAFYKTAMTSITIKNPNAVLGYKAFGVKNTVYGDAPNEDFIVYGYKGSTAEQYAKDYQLKFVELSAIEYLGDVDGDGAVSIIDATCIQRHLAEIPVYAYNEKAADTDGDGEVTILDATGIQRYLAELPCFAGIGNPIS